MMHEEEPKVPDFPRTGNAIADMKRYKIVRGVEDAIRHSWKFSDKMDSIVTVIRGIRDTNDMVLTEQQRIQVIEYVRRYSLYHGLYENEVNTMLELAQQN